MRSHLSASLIPIGVAAVLISAWMAREARVAPPALSATTYLTIWSPEPHLKPPCDPQWLPVKDAGAPQESGLCVQPAWLSQTFHIPECPETDGLNSCPLTIPDEPGLGGGQPSSVGSSLFSGLSPFSPSRDGVALNFSENGGSSTGGAALDSPYVDAGSGTMSYVETDLVLPGIGLGFTLGRMYRSENDNYDGQYGLGWQLNVHRRVKVTGWTGQSVDSFFFVDGSGYPDDGYTEDTNDWWLGARPNQYFKFVEDTSTTNNHQFVRYLQTGVTETYERIDDATDWFYLVETRDRFDNYVEFVYENLPSSSLPVLDEVYDTVGRTIDFEYDTTGRLDEVLVYAESALNDILLGTIDYVYKTSPNSSYTLLDYVSGLTVATDVGGTLTHAAQKHTYSYNTGDVLSGIKNGNSEDFVSWTYSSGKVATQVDRPGDARAGTHLYTYSTGPLKTTYRGPDNGQDEKREFYVDGDGRITKLREQITTSTWRTTEWEYDTGCACGQVKKVTFPSGRYEEFEYDADGNVTVIWQHPDPNAGDSLPPRVERFTWSDFDPTDPNDTAGSKLSTRLIYHELRRDAGNNETADNACNHPTCGQTINFSGYQLHTYGYSTDGKKLESIDYGAIQTGTNAQGGSTTTTRKETFTYETNGQLKTHTELEAGSAVSTLTFAYVSGNVTTATLSETATSDTWKLEVLSRDNWGRIKTLEGYDDETTAFYRDQTGRAYQVIEAQGQSKARTTDLRYDKEGRLVKQTVSCDGLTEVSVFTLDPTGAPETVALTGPSGSAKTTTFTVSPGGYPESIEDWRGYKVGVDWDGMGALRLPSKRWEQWGSGSQRTIWLAGDGSNDGYDDHGRLTLSQNAEGWETKYTYDGQSRLKTAMTEGGVDSAQTPETVYRGSIFNYDARGFLKEVEIGAEKSLGSQQLFQHHVLVHNTHGHLVAHGVYEDIQASIEARMAKFDIDTRGRTIKAVRYVGDKSATSPTLSTVEHEYDAMDRVVQSRIKDGSTTVETTDYDYEDASGYYQSIVSGAGSSYKEKTRVYFDELLRPTSTQEWEWTGSAYGNSRTWTRKYDGLDRLEWVKDPANVKQEWAYDALHRVKESKRTPSDASAAQVTTYDWNTTTGDLDGVEDAEGAITSYLYDGWKNVKKMTHPDGRYVEYSDFDDLDRPRKIKEYASSTATIPITHTLTWDYSRLKSDDTSGAGPAMVVGPDKIVWNYDEWTGRPTSSEMWTGTTLSWTTVYDVNDLGELESETQGTGAHARTWDYEYGYLGEMMAVDYPGILGLSRGEFTYDGAGRRTNLVYKDSAGTVADYDYTYAGMRMGSRSATIADLKLDLGRDKYGRLDSAIWSDVSGGGSTQLDGQERLFDTANRVIGRKRAIVGETIGDAFEHDGFGRMKKWYRGASAPLSYSGSGAPSTWAEVKEYELNEVYGRETVKTTPSGGSTATDTYTSSNGSAHFYDSIVEGGVTETRDEWNGRLEDDGTYQYRYDAWGRLTQVLDQSSTPVVLREHQYDAQGRRVREMRYDASANPATVWTRFLYMGMGLAGSFDESDGSNNRTYAFGGGADSETFVRIEDFDTSYDGDYELVRDFQGSILALVDRSDQSVVERYRYTPFGEVSFESGTGTSLSESDYGNERLFMGRLWDADIGIYDVRNRWYEPDRGAFLGPDPLGAHDSYNLYQYGFAAPGTFSDPFGLASQDAQATDRDTLASLVGSLRALQDARRKAQQMGATAAVECLDGVIDGIKGQIEGLAIKTQTVTISVPTEGDESPWWDNSATRLFVLDQVDDIRGKNGPWMQAFGIVTLFPVAKVAKFAGKGVFAAGGWAWRKVFGKAARGGLKLSKTVANHADDIVKKGPFKGQLARPYLNSPLTRQEIMSAAKGVPDPGGVSGALRWDVPGTFRGSQGTWELVVDSADRVLHWNFVR